MKKLLMASVALLSSPAYAQSVDDIIVTARKTPEIIDRVPATIRYYNAEDLESRNTVNLTDLNGFNQRSVPQNGDGFILSLRGQAQNDVSVTVDPSVGTYLDGIYIGRGYGLNSTLLDVDNVQILSGPQGTLFGRNTTGGAVLIETRDPLPGQTTIDGKISFGRFNEVIASTTVNTPITDNLTVRVSGLTVQRDGFTTDRITGTKYNDRETYQGRVKVLYNPTPGFENIFSFEMYDNTGGMSPRFMSYGYGNLRFLATPNPGDTVALDGGLTNSTRVINASMINKIGDFKITSGYRRVQTNYNGDFDGTSQNIYTLSNVVDIEQYTSEAQYNGFIGKLNYTLGAFYFEENGSEIGRASLYGGYQATQTGGTVGNRSYGGFFHGKYNLTSNVILNGGFRYTHDLKTVTTRNAVLNPTGNFAVCFSSQTNLQIGCALDQRASFNKWSWSAGLDYMINPTNIVYAKVSTGFKSGGNQIRAITVNGDGLEFQPENITEYEVGVKGNVGRIRYSLAGFYNEVDNMQILTVLTQPTVYTLVKNAAKARNFGIDAQLSARVTHNLSISATGSWVDPKFLKYNDPVTGVDLRGNRFNNVAETQFTLGANYFIDRFSFDANYVWIGKTDKLATSRDTLVSRYGVVEGDKIYKTTVIPSHGILNLRANYATDIGTFSIWGRNVTNQRIEKDIAPLEGLFNTTTYNDPATYGISYSFMF